MRAIHIVPTIADLSHGPTYSVPRLCESLQESGHDVTLLCAARADRFRSVPWVVNVPAMPLSGRLLYSPRLLAWLRQASTQGEPTVMHSHGLWQMPAVYPGWLARSKAVAYVASPRGALGKAAFDGGSPVKRIFWPLVQRPALRAATCFHATAASEAEEIRQHGFTQPIAVIPNGIDTPPQSSLLATRRKEVLFLSRIHPKKGIDLLLRAWRLVESDHPDWQLRIVGPDNGGHLKQMQALSVSLGLIGVRFVGDLHGQEKADAYRQAALFVLPTRNDNFAMVVAEALSFGTPCVVSKGAPWKGLVSERCGWWVDLDEGAIAKALLQAIATPPSQLRQMGENGRTWMQRDFSWDMVGKQMSELYEWLERGSPEWGRPSTVLDW